MNKLSLDNCKFVIINYLSQRIVNCRNETRAILLEVLFHVDLRSFVLPLNQPESAKAMPVSADRLCADVPSCFFSVIMV